MSTGGKSRPLHCNRQFRPDGQTEFSGNLVRLNVKFSIQIQHFWILLLVLLSSMEYSYNPDIFGQASSLSGVEGNS